MKQPQSLTRIPLGAALAIVGTPGTMMITKSIGQWDAMLAAAYDDNWLLLELDSNEMPVKAYQKGVNA